MNVSWLVPSVIREGTAYCMWSVTLSPGTGFVGVMLQSRTENVPPQRVTVAALMADSRRASSILHEICAGQV